MIAHRATSGTTASQIPAAVKWRRQVLYWYRLGRLDGDMVARCFLLAEGVQGTDLMPLRGKGHRSHWTEDQIAQVWGVSTKTARGYLHRLHELGLLGFWRGNRRLPSERWLLEPDRDRTPANWPWGAFASLRSGVETELAVTPLSPVDAPVESSNLEPLSSVESGSRQHDSDPTFRSYDSVGEPNGSIPGDPDLTGDSSVDTSGVSGRPGVTDLPGEDESLKEEDKPQDDYELPPWIYLDADPDEREVYGDLAPEQLDATYGVVHIGGRRVTKRVRRERVYLDKELSGA